MKHIVHIMIGDNAATLLCDLKRYVVKYGNSDENDYFSALLYSDSDGSAAIMSAEPAESDGESFTSGIDDMFDISLRKFYDLPQQNRAEYLKACFTALYNQRITINNPGDSNRLHLCLYVPLYTPEYWAIAEEMLQAIEAIEQAYTVDLFLLPYDMAFLIEQDKASLPVRMDTYREQTRQTVSLIINAKARFRSVEHLVMMQNCNSNGLSLNLNEDSLIRIIGEYALLSVSHYDDIFSQNTQDPQRPIHALGLSVLSFDKYYFVQYLLHRAYIHILDRENVKQTDVDVNKVSQIVQTILAKHVNVFTDFYNRHVQPRLEKHIDQDTIMAEIKPELDAQISNLTAEFQSYIDSPGLSLPEKKATLAQLLGEDDELLTGYIFNRSQLVIDDCSREALDYFVEQNNALCRMHEEIADTDTLDEITRKQKVNLIARHAALSGLSNAEQEMPGEIINDLKQVKIRMRESSNYIRLKSIELDQINRQTTERQESHKRLTDNGFVFEGNTYRLQDNDIVERALDEDYVPRRSMPAKVDLRKYFTPVKDQGSLGACSSFSIVAIYEYILKKNKALESDLSEAFVYYYAHSRESDPTDDGTSLYNNIVAVQTEGVCQERLCPYLDRPNDAEPTDEAKSDALLRRIRKALNVKKDISHLKSAISQGYPVAVSLKIFDSFNPIDGFIPRPSDEEISSNQSGNHAMVLCGYSDEEKIFIARNSWGIKFGNQGYCFLPYSYIEDFMNVACIVTEINMDNIHVAGNDTHTTISFDLTNSHIKSAILRNLIEEEKRTLGVLNHQLLEYDNKYNQVFQALGNNAARTTLCDGTQLRLQYEQQQLMAEKEKLEPERVSELSLFDKQTKINSWRYGLSWLAPIGLYTILLWPLRLNPITVLFNKWSYIFYGITALVSLLFILWRWQRRSKRYDLDHDYKTRIENRERRIQELDRRLEVVKLKSHVAGMIIDSLSQLFRNLHSKYNCLNSYVGNLSVWRDEEILSSCMSDQVKDPFLTLISNTCLDRFFNTCKDQITENIKLYSMFRNSYKVDESEIIRFKNQLKQRLIDELFAKLNDFSVYKHIAAEEHYPYAIENTDDINTLLRRMDQKSQYFVRTVSSIDTVSSQNTNCKLLFVDTDIETTRHRWDALCRKNFSKLPVCHESNSHFKLTLIQMVGLSTDEIAILNNQS